VGARDRCCDVEGQLAVHLSRHLARRKPQQLDSNGDCELVGSRDSDAYSIAALPSCPCQRFGDNIPVPGSVDSLQDARGIRSRRPLRVLDLVTASTTQKLVSGDLVGVSQLAPKQICFAGPRGHCSWPCSDMMLLRRAMSRHRRRLALISPTWRGGAYRR
jgi:hypothetical protein